jgi:hypothetical protein
MAIHVPLLHIARSTLNISIGFTTRKRAQLHTMLFSQRVDEKEMKGRVRSENSVVGLFKLSPLFLSLLPLHSKIHNNLFYSPAKAHIRG